ncbi:CGNR zinc finger protein [Nocardioides albertanoniae]|uniref:CGNR zinc finger protein n=1 Tax=Nocardioides albertanoniae TaxID=1175486 RepID=A0A543AD53_9ACTN|nr:CGNR zinc finger domain-containing protein [Nocardioides albertanoniae]TQL70507.1 CGNR zinc finger protein [Nocardioides albertanoniae]
MTEQACKLVNALTPGHDGTRVVATPPVGRRAEVVRDLLARPDYKPQVGEAAADGMVALAESLRIVFAAAAVGDLDTAATTVNVLLREMGSVPQLDRARGGGWALHFHGREPDLVVGWGAGIAAGLALAIGSDLAGRLGLCQADPCDRVFVDTSKNAGRRFCSTRCQSRMKAAAHRARQK